jgi:sodium/hydrogen antiporter
MEQGLDAATVSVVAASIVLWGLVSARLTRWDISAPIVFVVLGLVTAHGPVTLVHLNLRSSTIREIAEITLVVVLFSDACRVNVRAMRADFALPVRLLGIGLPLTIGAGVGIAFGLFSGAGIWAVAALGAIVAPTDAALGASIMEDERVPPVVRRSLNIESGLNDGIVTPVVNLFLAGAASSEAVSSLGIGQAAVELVGGAAIGLGIGALGAWLLTRAARARWSSPGTRALAVLALAVCAYAVALQAGTNGFVAAFLAGVAYGTVTPGDDNTLFFTEDAGRLLSLLVWFVFGAVMLVPGVRAAGWRDLVFALLALTVVRMLPVAFSLAGTGLSRSSTAFIGWFGPRGLASVVFGLLAYDTLSSGPARTVLAATVVTVALSVLAHGLSAAPLAGRYGAAVRRLDPSAPERREAPVIATRSLSELRTTARGDGG